MHQMIKKSAINGPNICILKEFSKSPWRARHVDSPVAAYESQPWAVEGSIVCPTG